MMHKRERLDQLVAAATAAGRAQKAVDALGYGHPRHVADLTVDQVKAALLPALIETPPLERLPLRIGYDDARLEILAEGVTRQLREQGRR